MDDKILQWIDDEIIRVGEQFDQEMILVGDVHAEKMIILAGELNALNRTRNQYLLLRERKEIFHG